MLTKVNWLITLKIQIVKLTNFALLRNDVLTYRKGTVSFIDTNYLTLRGDNIAACESPTYKLVRIICTLNSSCVNYTFQYFRYIVTVILRISFVSRFLGFQNMCYFMRKEEIFDDL